MADYMNLGPAGNMKKIVVSFNSYVPGQPIGDSVTHDLSGSLLAQSGPDARVWRGYIEVISPVDVGFATLPEILSFWKDNVTLDFQDETLGTTYTVIWEGDFRARWMSANADHAIVTFTLREVLA